ncbi:NACHT domain-containing protein [Streptomyces sp. NPDC006132]|uniref:NACHT domain-containing protein n=1 Tax=Streptomyces sp. NPDC006132 TaxID=3156732 RepID=UPI0033FE24BF
MGGGRTRWWWRLYACLALLVVGAVLYAQGVDRVDAIGKVVGVVAALLGLPPLLLAAFGLQRGAAQPAEQGPGELADRLAVAVRRQWEAEAEVRRLSDPYPLPVAWTAADPALTEEWSLIRSAGQEAPGGPVNDPGRWADGPEGLSGSGSDIEQVFLDRVPTRRLVLLGEPGAGKTMVLVRLLLALLDPAHRADGGPVPFLFSLASFDPAAQDLRSWMVHELTREHPALGGPAQGLVTPPGGSRRTLAHELLDHRLLLPLFDGLDELPAPVRPVVLDAINQTLDPKQALVLSCRTAEYGQALGPDGEASAGPLNGAAGIVLEPLDAGTAIAYLSRDAGGGRSTGAERWARVADALADRTSPVARALSTPLGLFMARTIYNPRPGERPAGRAHPDELVDAGFPTRADVESHLFGAFVRAAYRPHPSRPVRWSPRQAEKYLAFLAHHLDSTLAGTPNLAWWQLSAGLPGYRPVLVLALWAALLAWPVLGGPAALMSGALVCLATGVGALFSPVHEESGPSMGVGWVPNVFVGVGAGAGAVAGLALGLPFGAENGVATALAAGLVGAVAGGLGARIPSTSAAVSPGDLLVKDRRTFLCLWFVSGSAAAVAIGTGTSAELGLAAGLAFGTFVGTGGSLWWRYATTRFLLAARGRVPWRLMGFLADAHANRGVLRRAGTVYQFRHLGLQRHLAHRYAAGRRR